MRTINFFLSILIFSLMTSTAANASLWDTFTLRNAFGLAGGLAAFYCLYKATEQPLPKETAENSNENQKETNQANLVVQDDQSNDTNSFKYNHPFFAPKTLIAITCGAIAINYLFGNQITRVIYDNFCR